MPRQRKPKEKSREIITLRLTKREKTRLKKLADYAGLSVSDFIRELLAQADKSRSWTAKPDTLPGSEWRIIDGDFREI